MDTPTTLGVGIVLASNTVISLALNIQKLSHRRLGTERSSPPTTPAATSGTGNGATKPRFKPSTAVILEAEPDERDPLLASRPPLRTSISSPRAGHAAAAIQPRRSTSLTAGRGSRLVPKSRLAAGSPTSAADQVDVPAVLTVSLVPGSSAQSTTSAVEEQDDSAPSELPREADYLRSKLWWLGFVLMNVGEFGNFLSYAYAPASVIAPLGASALIANCFFSPLVLHENFRKRDILGIALTVLGALTLVSAAKSSDPRLDPAGLLAAITQRVFVIYAAINFAVAALLVWLSERPAGDKFIAIDIGICALFGGFTVLSTKGISTLVSMYGFGVFAIWLTYPLLVVLLVTGIGQIKYLNRALMRFDSKAVIPSQFVGFNLAVITGSAILFRDFDDVTFSRFLSFLNGCAMTFLGVWVLATKTNVASGEVQDDGEASTEVGPDHAESPVDLEHGPRRDPSITRAISVPVVLRRKASAPALGLSPGQHLLIAADWEAVNTGAGAGAGGSLRGRERGRESRDGSVSARRRTVAFG